MPIQKLDGAGMLGRLGSPVVEWRVKYAFTIGTLVSKGTITALDGSVIPEGLYQLVAEDDEIHKVRNVGLGKWVILSPMQKGRQRRARRTGQQ